MDVEGDGLDIEPSGFAFAGPLQPWLMVPQRFREGLNFVSC